jgi:uncharacterized membrane protein/nitrite reductase/ring-hydroxylating ferredoxin subunit
MKTFASIKGHSIHPILIPFPIAFLTAAVVCDAVGWLADLVEWRRIAAWSSLAGIGTAVLAAIPGVLDYLFTVPPNSSGKQRATRHMIVNLSAVALFAAAWYFRRDGIDLQHGWPVTVIELVGILLISIGGWLGGTLVYRNFIGPEHRYARAGKWRELRLEAGRGDPIKLCRADELEVDQMRLLHVGDKRIVLARTEMGYQAFQDRCTHKGGSLADGVLMCGRVQCLWHGSQFDVASGKVAAGPAKEPIQTYRVEERDGFVYVALD